MSDEAAFLAKIIDRPGDDVPRLVYADWLDEQPERVPCPRMRSYPQYDLLCGRLCPTCEGERRVPNPSHPKARAEFIRVQCELAGLGGCLTPSVGARESGSGKPLSCWQVRPRNKRGCLPWCEICSRSADLREREAELLDENWSRWIRGAGLVPDGWRLSTDGDSFHVWRDDPFDDGFRFQFRRGFVEEVRAPLAALFGTTCPRCSGEGCSPHAIAANGPCENREGAAAGLWASQPVLAVRLTDREPMELTDPSVAGRPWVWDYHSETSTARHTLPAAIHSLLGGAKNRYENEIRYYPTRQAALDALSAAACALGRERAGLEAKT